LPPVATGTSGADRLKKMKKTVILITAAAIVYANVQVGLLLLLTAELLRRTCEFILRKN
jgi:hypothetical protein